LAPETKLFFNGLHEDLQNLSTINLYSFIFSFFKPDPFSYAISSLTPSPLPRMSFPPLHNSLVSSKTGSGKTSSLQGVMSASLCHCRSHT
jgi:hypothetical protein